MFQEELYSTDSDGALHYSYEEILSGSVVLPMQGEAKSMATGVLSLQMPLRAPRSIQTHFLLNLQENCGQGITLFVMISDFLNLKKIFF